MALKIDYDALEYDVLWRPNFELSAVGCWLGASGVAGGFSLLSEMPSSPFYAMAAICGMMAMSRLPKGIRLYTLQKHLNGRKLEFIKLDAVKEKMKDIKGEVWLGNGFEWESRHTQRVFEILKRDWSAFKKKPTSYEKAFKPNEVQERKHAMGQFWIHGVEPEEEKLTIPLSHTGLHTLVVGSTGCGKTRMFDVLISQAIMRKDEEGRYESVIIIDPKGDKELRDNARRACEALGCPERFVVFSPAFPEDSARIDPLRNFSRVTEIASRLAALIQTSNGTSDPFKSFGWQALNHIAQGAVITHERPTIATLKHFLEGGSASLVIKAVSTYAEKHIGASWEKKCAPFTEPVQDAPIEKLAGAYMRFYHEVVAHDYPSSELEGLLSMYKHDSTHFSKMVSNLLPIMNMLTSGELGKLLSPDIDDLDDQRVVTDTSKIINRGQVLYCGLDSLSDAIVSTALGSMFISDLTAVCGDRYNFGVDNRPVNLFVDEAGECVSDPLVQILNKGRGGGYRVTLAVQSILDIAARLGSKEKATQVLANCNNLFALRTIDSETQQYITENLPKTRVKSVTRSQGQSVSSDEPLLHGGSQSEMLKEEEADLFPPQLLGMLPNLEYIARISGGKIIKGRLPILIN